MFLANGSYQGTVGLFVAVTLIYIIKYSKNIKDFILLSLNGLEILKLIYFFTKNNKNIFSKK